MSEIQEIDVIVKPDGTVRLEVRGVKGRKCLALTEGIEELLGGAVSERVFTDEYEQENVEQTLEDTLEQRRT
ncbi:MAG: DUF2997 domain-containing protein [Pseudomonadota bacterium]